MNLILTQQLSIFLVCTTLLAFSSAAEISSASGACKTGTIETTPSNMFTLIEDGTVVRHETTGLEWRRCAEGMSWNGSSCEWNHNPKTWKEALQQADTLSGWRLPNIKELHSIVEQCRTNPAINQNVFPSQVDYSFNYWSATPALNSVDRAMQIDFNDGSINIRYQYNSYYIRLVRDKKD